ISLLLRARAGSNCRARAGQARGGPAGRRASPRTLSTRRGGSMKPIQVWDYRAEYEDERAEITHAIETVLRSGRLILGEQVRRFETDFSAFCGTGYGVGVNSGTDALFLGLKALDVGAGDEVIT